MPENPIPSSAKQKALEAKSARVAAAKVLSEQRAELKKSVGQTFADGEQAATVTAFEPDQNIKGVIADAFLVNFGNPNLNKFVHCEAFLAEFKPQTAAVAVEQKG